MLGSAGPARSRSGALRGWRLDWQATYPGAILAPTRDSLSRHLDALLAQPLPEIPLDGALIEAARATFSRVLARQPRLFAHRSARRRRRRCRRGGRPTLPARPARASSCAPRASR